MSLETRLKKLEQHFIKSLGYERGMAIMKELIKAEEEENFDIIPDLMLKLYENGQKNGKK